MLINTDKEILNLGERFYKDLYSSKLKTDSSVGIDTFLSCEDSAPLNPEEPKSCEGRPTKPECLEALKSMASGKSPGTDGLPAEFYKVFWNNISDLLLNAINYGYENGQLSTSQRRGIIRLIPKKDSDPHFIKNWRPITLLN